MIVRWSPEAATDLAAIVDYIGKQNPLAERIARSVYNDILSLSSFPNQGRQGRQAGTRELVLSPLPFIVVYRVKEDAVEIARVLHGSQRWP